MLFSVHCYLCGFAGLTMVYMVYDITDVSLFSTYFSFISLTASGWPVKLMLYIKRQSFACVDKNPRLHDSWGLHVAHLGPTRPRWAPCWSHELCYQGFHPNTSSSSNYLFAQFMLVGCIVVHCERIVIISRLSVLVCVPYIPRTTTDLLDCSLLLNPTNRLNIPSRHSKKCTWWHNSRVCMATQYGMPCGVVIKEPQYHNGFIDKREEMQGFCCCTLKLNDYP